MMMRVVDFEAYCQSIKVPDAPAERLSLKLSEKKRPWNEGVYQVESYNHAA